MMEVSFHQARGRLNTTPSRSYPACVMRPRAGAHRARQEQVLKVDSSRRARLETIRSTPSAEPWGAVSRRPGTKIAVCQPATSSGSSALLRPTSTPRLQDPPRTSATAAEATRKCRRESPGKLPVVISTDLDRRREQYYLLGATPGSRTTRAAGSGPSIGQYRVVGLWDEELEGGLEFGRPCSSRSP